MNAYSVIQILFHGLFIGSIYVCISLGLDVIVGVLGIINMAHGQFIVYGMYISFFMYTIYNLKLMQIFLIVPIIYAIISIPLYFGLFQLVMNKGLATQLFFTASLSVVLSNAVVVLWKSDPRQLQNAIRSQCIHFGPFLLNKLLFIAFLICVTATGIVFLFLYKTERGSIIRAIIMNRELISLIGIKPENVYIQGFIIGMTLTGIGSFLLSLYYPIGLTVAKTFNLYMWASVLLGGVGTIRGALLGGTIIGLVQALSAYILPAAFQDFIVLSLFIIILN
jgi:branched-chain amino acid transport system permease protein